MCRTIFAALLLGAAAHRARAQQSVPVTGVVHDASSARPLIGAVVSFDAAGNARTTRTDETGAFMFSKVAPGAHSLSARRLGYEQVNQLVDVRAELPSTYDVRYRGRQEIMMGRAFDPVFVYLRLPRANRNYLQGMWTVHPIFARVYARRADHGESPVTTVSGDNRLSVSARHQRSAFSTRGDKWVRGCGNGKLG